MLFFALVPLRQRQTVKYENGNAWNGKGFETKSFHIRNGEFTSDESVKAHKVVNLKGKFVIPPLTNAHTHNFDRLEQFDSIYEAYIKEGVFYIQVLNNHHSHYERIKDSVNQSGRISVKFAHGGITSRGGHPQNLYEAEVLGYGWRAMFDASKKKELMESKTKEGDAYYLIDTVDDLNERWVEIMSKILMF